MRIVLFSGTHPRHLYVHQALLAEFEIAGVVCMQRETLMPTAEPAWAPHDRELFKLHFQRRQEVEKAVYGEYAADFYQKAAPTLLVLPHELNSPTTCRFVSSLKADICFVFGTGLILGSLLELLPKWKINMHLGLSPWYKGSATLFWPFYFMQPQFAGATFHFLTPGADAGDIIHQTVPELKRGEGIHDVSANVVKTSRLELKTLFERLVAGKVLPEHRQKITGRLFLERDFEAHHLRALYDLFRDRLVEEWLDGNLGTRLPKLVRAF